MVGKKIYLVCQESNVDGEIFFDVVPCSTMEKAKEVLKGKKNLLKESYHFGGRSESELKKEFEVEESDTRFFVYDTCDDYHEDIWIEEKEIV